MPHASVNGTKLYYEIRGTGEPLLFLCGTGVDHTSWNALSSFFEREYRCILYDNRGIGRSDTPQEGYEIETMADDAIELLGFLGVDRAILMGWSVGTVIAIEVANRRPGLVSGLVLHGTCDRTYPHMRRRIEIQIELAKLERKSLLAAYSVLHLFSPQFINEHEDVVQEFQNRVMNSPTRPPLAVMIKHYQVSFGYFERAREERFGNIKVPTLITVGSEDQLTRPEYCRSVHEKVPGSEFIVVPGADHTMPVLRPAELSQVTLEFLGRHNLRPSIAAATVGSTQRPG